MNRVITLTTGWADDFYVAALKGILLSSVPSVQIIDMSHHAPAFSSGITYAAYMVKQSYKYFPQGAIHIISIASEYHNSSPFISVFHDGHFFIGTDNGFFGMIFDDTPETIVRIEKFKDDESPNYPALSVFAPAAIHLANGGDIAELGSICDDFQRKGTILPLLESSQITGTILHINAFGNAITNISREDFERIGKGRPFEIMVNSIRQKITSINKYFHETSTGELLALFNISGYLEVAQNKGKLAELMRLTLNSNIIVKFT